MNTYFPEEIYDDVEIYNEDDIQSDRLGEKYRRASRRRSKKFTNKKMKLISDYATRDKEKTNRHSNWSNGHKNWKYSDARKIDKSDVLTINYDDDDMESSY